MILAPFLFRLKQKSCIKLGVVTNLNKGFINSASQLHVQVGQAARVVGDQINAHTVPHVAPLGVMVHGFGDQGHLGHKPKGLHKVGKDKVAVQSSINQLPVGQGDGEGGEV